MSFVPAYIRTNLIESVGAAGITSSSEDSAYPHENLYDRNVAKPFRFTSGSATHWVEIDFGAAVAFNSVAILGHNFSGMLAATVKAGASPDPSTTVGLPILGRGSLYVDCGAQSARYVRVTLPVSAGSNAEIGELVIGVREPLPRAPRWLEPQPRLAPRIRHESYGGTVWESLLHTRREYRPEFRFPSTEFAAFNDFWVRTLTRPFTYIPQHEISGDLSIKMDMSFDSAPSLMATYIDFTGGSNKALAPDPAYNNVRRVYTFEGFSIPSTHVTEFAFLCSSSARTFKVWSIRIFRGGREVRRILPSEMAAWTNVDIGSEALVGDYFTFATTAINGRLVPATSMANDVSASYCRLLDDVFDPTPVGPAKDNSVVQDWFDWRPNIRTESEGLIVSA